MKFVISQTIEDWEIFEKSLDGSNLTNAIYSDLNKILRKHTCTNYIPLKLKKNIELPDDISEKLICAARSVGMNPTEFIRIFILLPRLNRQTAINSTPIRSS